LQNILLKINDYNSFLSYSVFIQPSNYIDFLYGLAQFNLLINYYKSKKPPTNNEVLESIVFDYNYSVAHFYEKYQNDFRFYSKLEYPRDKLQIQVLDDSTGESMLILIKKTSESRFEY
jgi:hypothetical protein